jgi:flagellar biosynthesis chaperone FliJ
VEKARTLLAEAHQRQATIAKLRERDQQAENAREARREQRRSDDRAAMRRN